MGCILAACVIAVVPVGAVVMAAHADQASSSVARFARDDRAAAVRDGVFTDRVVVRCTAGTTIDRLSSSLDETTSPFGALASRWSVRFVLPTFFPAPQDEVTAHRLGMDRYATLVVPDGTDVWAMAAEFAKLGDQIELAEVDLNGHAHIAPTDVLFGQQWALNNTGQVVNGRMGTAGADIRAEAAWDLTHTLSPVVVAILDTGVSQSHPDLVGIQVDGQNTATASTPLAWDDNTSVSHGTYCAGIAGAAFGNSIGIAGVAPSIRIMPVKVLVNIQLGSQTTCANGLTWATDHGARVASMSLGWGGSTSTLNTAIAYAAAHNVLMCASTGNSPGSAIAFPANAGSDVIAVGGTDNTDAPFVGGTTGSQMGLVAPAVDVLCTCDDFGTAIDGYSLQTGTSMACPIVAGVAALVMSEEPSLTAAQVRDVLESSADDLGETGRDPIYGFGRVNAEAALRAAHRLACPIDMDGNGQIDVYDIFAYIGYFFAQDPRADFDHSGVVEIADMFAFLSAYLAAGC
jgi:subtilisin family serine protease